MADSDVISAFHDGVTNDRMLEKLDIRDNLTSAAELIDMSNSCAKAEEGRLFRHNAPLNEPTIAVSKGKNKTKGDNAETKRKAPTVLAVEPKRKYKRNDGAPEVDNHPFCAFHQMHSHATENCFQLERLRGDRLMWNSQEGPSRGGGWRGSGRGGGRGGGRWGEPHQNTTTGSTTTPTMATATGTTSRSSLNSCNSRFQIGRAHV